jgi:hypothetical protein
MINCRAWFRLGNRDSSTCNAIPSRNLPGVSIAHPCRDTSLTATRSHRLVDLEDPLWRQECNEWEILLCYPPRRLPRRNSADYFPGMKTFRLGSFELSSRATCRDGHSSCTAWPDQYNPLPAWPHISRIQYGPSVRVQKWPKGKLATTCWLIPSL